MFIGNKRMSTITVRLDGDDEELILAVKIIQSIIDKNEADKIKYQQERKEKRKKKTVDELIEEIEDEIRFERDTITDSNIEIENLELKRAELEKYEKQDVIKKAIIVIKKKREKKVKTETELVPEKEIQLQLIPEND
jgi:hypothetical protein